MHRVATLLVGSLLLAWPLHASASTCSCLDSPDRGVAASFSLAFGFGVGHFYAQKPGAGMLFGAVDIVGGSLLVSSRGEPVDPSRASLERQATRAKVGAYILSASRAIQVVSAPAAARATIEERGGTRSEARHQEASPDVARSTTEQVYRALGWTAEPGSDQWQLDVATVRAYLAEGTLPSDLVRAARAGAQLAGEEARLATILGLGLKAVDQH